MKEGLDYQEYKRQRLAPEPGDPLYLVLSDLLLALKELLPQKRERVLDYGCGGSPYRPLFGNCVYHRADFEGFTGLDFEYGPDSRLPPKAGGYDCVLSTQVLEHVEDPVTYLRECHRVLTPGGSLLLTTHGAYEDHSCPHDYWRWTAAGLERTITAAGFELNALKKVTTGPRAAVFLSEREQWELNFASEGLYGAFVSLGVRLGRKLGARRLHEASDKSFLDYRVVDANDSGHELYLVVAALARRQ